MDCILVKEREIVIDIDNFIETSREVGTPALSDDKIGNMVSFTVCGMPVSADEMVKGENSASLCSNPKNVDELSPGSGKNSKREKHKSMSGKKPPKPPRPPRGLSLDAADQKLIKEISELVMIKRARIERMKALKKMKAAKASSTSTSSNGSLMAMAFTIIFCIVIILQGCHSSGVSLRNESAAPIPGLLESSRVAKDDIIVMQDQRNLITGGEPLTSVESPYAMDLVSGSDTRNVAEKAIH